MKVLLISNYQEGSGGISVQVKMLAKHLVKEGVQTEIFSTKGSVLYRIKAFFSLWKKGRHYDTLHIHACSQRGFFPAIIGITVGKMLHKRIVLTYHGGDAESYFSSKPRFVKFWLSKTDVNIVLSEYLGEVFRHFDIPYVVIPNIMEIDASRFRARNNPEPKFICIRSHTATYNIECIIKAFQIVKKELPYASLALAGDGPLHNQLIEYVSSNDIKDISFIGKVPNDKIYDYLAQADIMLSAPLIDNMPVSLLEGFNAGLLVISSNVGGVRYMIDDHENGLLFESGNANELASKMIWAVNHAKEFADMTNAAFSKLEYYSWSKIWDKLRTEYQIHQ